jgi:hypothetical protein
MGADNARPTVLHRRPTPRRPFEWAPTVAGRRGGGRIGNGFTVYKRCKTAREASSKKLRLALTLPIRFAKGV